MKRIILLAFFTLIIMGFTPFETKKSLTQTQLKFIKDNYKWNTEKLLIINFRHKRENCFYDNTTNLEGGRNWWSKFYSKINLNKVLNIYVYSDSVSAKKIIDTKTKFEDYVDFLLATFFNTKKECYGILVINSNGEYEIHEGEYTVKQVKGFIKTLKK